MAQGGIIFGVETFASEAGVVAMTIEEDPRGADLADFANPLIICCHVKSCKPSKSWRLVTKTLKVTDDFTESELRFLVDCKTQYHTLYMWIGGLVKAGPKLPVFASKL